MLISLLLCATSWPAFIYHMIIQAGSERVPRKTGQGCVDGSGGDRPGVSGAPGWHALSTRAPSTRAKPVKVHGPRRNLKRAVRLQRGNDVVVPSSVRPAPPVLPSARLRSSAHVSAPSAHAPADHMTRVECMKILMTNKLPFKDCNRDVDLLRAMVVEHSLYSLQTPVDDSETATREEMILKERAAAAAATAAAAAAAAEGAYPAAADEMMSGVGLRLGGTMTSVLF